VFRFGWLIDMQFVANQFGLTAGQCATLACVLEATAPKPGNVHRGADFEDLTYPDLVLSGIAIGPEMDSACKRPLGKTVLAAVQRTQRLVRGNSNLGMILLLAPLAAAATESCLENSVRHVLDSLTPDDARHVYQAIRLAKPGGLGKVEEADIAGDPPDHLIDAMRMAADRDLVARQYANGFQEVLQEVTPAIRDALRRFCVLDAIVYAYLKVLSNHPDSLIVRKCGPETASRASHHAAEILAAASPGDDHWHRAVADLDFWLRSDGHRRNPGTTADLITAGLFVTLWEGSLNLPLESKP
jgi:triphosphoribosyl-dephospho-CoA synthase